MSFGIHIPSVKHLRFSSQCIKLMSEDVYLEFKNWVIYAVFRPYELNTQVLRGLVSLLLFAVTGEIII